jgi:uncharacterized MAPEG superfamily protein
VSSLDVQVVLASHAASVQRGYLCTAGPRDEAVPPLTGIAGRLERALRNFVETFPLLASAVLIAYVANTHKSDKDPRTTAGKSPLDVLFETNSFAATE